MSAKVVDLTARRFATEAARTDAAVKHLQRSAEQLGEKDPDVLVTAFATCLLEAAIAAGVTGETLDAVIAELRSNLPRDPE